MGEACSTSCLASGVSGGSGLWISPPTPGTGLLVWIYVFPFTGSCLFAMLSFLYSVYTSSAQLLSHLPFQAEDKKAALPMGLSAAEKADAHEEEELQAAEEVSGP